MKRILLIFACLIILTACGKTELTDEADMKYPIRFYYCRTDEEAYGSDTGVLGWELRDLGDYPWTTDEILELYLQGPQNEYLWMPFEQSVYTGNSRLEDGVLYVSVSGEFAALPAVHRSITAACLVHTMAQLEQVEAVQLELVGGNNLSLVGTPLTPEDFLLLDDTAISDQTTVKLYFADQQKRYLIEESRHHAFDAEEEIPLFILRQLLDGPEQKGVVSAFPKNTRLYSVKNLEGVCTVNLSAEFASNLPNNHREARLAVFSIVNSLTELKKIECVQILINGQYVHNYAGLDLSQPFYRDERVIQKKQTDDREEDCTIWLPCGEQNALAEIPVMVYRTAGRSLELDLINELLSYEERNGYQNPFPDGTMAMEVRIQNRICTVLFNSTFALSDSDPVQASQTVDAVVRTLCGLEGIDAVQIMIHNGKMTSVDLSNALSPEME